jgi:hypothetical protein
MQKGLDYYSNLFTSNNRFIFIKDIKLQEVLYQFSSYVSFIYFEEILKQNTSEELSRNEVTHYFYLSWFNY